MTVKEYADYRAITRQAVNNHIRMGKIPAKAWKSKKPGSKHKVINSRLADNALEDSKILSNNPTGKRKPGKVSKKAAKSKGNGKGINDKFITIEAAGLDFNVPTAEATRLKTLYDAAIKKQTYEKNEGILIDAEEALKTYAKVVTACKTKLLSVQSKVAPLIQDAIDDPAAAAEIIKTIDDLHREALDDLAGG